MTIEEAPERLLCAVLSEFADRDDEDIIPLRSFMQEVGRVCGVTDYDLSVLPEWKTVGWLRNRMRIARQSLAEGEKIP